MILLFCWFSCSNNNPDLSFFFYSCYCFFFCTVDGLSVTIHRYLSYLLNLFNLHLGLLRMKQEEEGQLQAM